MRGSSGGGGSGGPDSPPNFWRFLKKRCFYPFYGHFYVFSLLGPPLRKSVGPHLRKKNGRTPPRTMSGSAHDKFIVYVQPSNGVQPAAFFCSQYTIHHDSSIIRHVNGLIFTRCEYSAVCSPSSFWKKKKFSVVIFEHATMWTLPSLCKVLMGNHLVTCMQFASVP